MDIGVRLKYERGDRPYARTSVAVSWGDTRSIVPGGRGSEENTGYPWLVVANNTDSPSTWHEVTLERVLWGDGKFCIGFGIWGHWSDKAQPPIVGQHRMWVDWVRVRHSPPLPPGDYADFSADVTTGATPLTVHFTDQSQVVGASAWYWEFGDGQISTQQNPAHTYTAVGTYTVRLTVTGSAGQCSAQKLDLITAVPSFADFAADVTAGPPPLTVQFTDQSQVPGAEAWYWEFGDGDTSDEQNPEHIYTVEGAMTVRLTVTAGGTPHTEEKVSYIQIATFPKVAFIGGSMPPTASDASVIQHLEVMDLVVDAYDDERENRPTASEIAATHDLVVASSTTLSGNVAGDFRHEAVPFILWESALAWNSPEVREAIADGGVAIGGQTQIDVIDNTHPIMAGMPTGPVTLTTSGQDFSYCEGSVASGAQVLATAVGNSGRRTMIAVEPGAQLLDGGVAAGKRAILFLYDTTWLATNATGKQILDNAVAWALDPKTASFSASSTSGHAPLTVTFTDESTGPVTLWTWDFGDGGGSTLRNPTHTYTQPGTYNVTLTVDGSTGQPDTLVRSAYLVVGDPHPADFDVDGDVDGDDCDHLTGCMGGPNVPPVGNCDDADLDGDGDVDQEDFGLLQRCLSGPDVPTDPDCVD